MTLDVLILIAGAAAGSVVFGISGFAFGLTSSAIWLQVFPPAQVVPLAVICPLVLNLVTLPQIRHDVSIHRLWPFALGATAGIPLGVAALSRTDEAMLRLAIGVLLVGYSAYALTRPTLPRVRLTRAAGRAADTGVGLIGGTLGGVSGLSVVLPSLWIGMRGWTKAEERGLLQSFGFYNHLLIIVVFAAVIGLNADTGRALLVCLPVAIAGSLIGMHLFRRMSGDGFRRAVLWIILAGGALLVTRVARG